MKMKMKILMTLSLFLLAGACFAQGMTYPARGTSMDSVLSQAGEPEVKRNAVGEPPITRWVYADYTIYFENQSVIHVVKNGNK